LPNLFLTFTPIFLILNNMTTVSLELPPSLPQVIILYGPPLAGKGTQGAYLESTLPHYTHLDFGTELRDYVAKGLEQTEDKDMFDRATRMSDLMNRGIAVDTPDLRFVVEKRITDSITAGKKLLIEGPGRKIEEAQWLSNFFAQKELDVAIFHLHISLDEALRRSLTRWYQPNNALPFFTLEDATKACVIGEKPYQRPEDLDPAINTRRYSEIYLNNFAQVIQAYQLNCDCDVLTVDASVEIKKVSKTISAYLKEYYDFLV
jgi:adenylate kinase family enzyme